jgi:ferredoxin
VKEQRSGSGKKSRHGHDDLSATVRFEPSGRELTVPLDTTLMDAVLAAGLALSQACDGVLLCGFCRVIVTDGGENLSPMGEEEERLLQSLRADPSERLACCATVHGSVTLTNPYWGGIAFRSIVSAM